MAPITEIKQVKTRRNNAMEKVSIASKDQALTVMRFVERIKAGEKVDPIKISNIDSFIAQLKKKGLNKQQRVKILQELYFNNKRQIENIKANLKKKEAVNIQAKISRSADKPVFTPKYTQAEMDAQKNKVTAARNALNDAKQALDDYLYKYNVATKEYNECVRKTFCNAKKKGSSVFKGKSVYIAYTWLRDQGIPSKRAAVAEKEKVFNTEDRKYQNMIKENKDYLALQKKTWEEERARQEELRRQEKQEANLRKEGLNEQFLKLQIAKQAEEILSLERKSKQVSDDKSKNMMGITASSGMSTAQLGMALLGVGLIASVVYFKFIK